MSDDIKLCTDCAKPMEGTAHYLITICMGEVLHLRQSLSALEAENERVKADNERLASQLEMSRAASQSWREELEKLRVDEAQAQFQVKALTAKLKDEKANHDSLKHILSALEIMMRDEVALLSKEDPDFADGSIASTLTALMTYTRRITSDNSHLSLELEAARAKATGFAKAIFSAFSKFVGRGDWLRIASHSQKETDYLVSAGVLEKHESENWYRWLPLPAADEIGGSE